MDHLFRYDVLNQQVSLLSCCLRIFFDALTSGCAEFNAIPSADSDKLLSFDSE
jgi:hypothetical protein